jgi:hypothetical protein
MKRRNILGLVGLGVVLLGWALFRPELLFIDKSINESFPSGTVVPTSANTATPSAAPITMGLFRGIAHETKGTATIFQLAEGKRVLRLTDFVTSNGPDVRVLLVAAADATDNETVKAAGYLELGSLKGNMGNQNYDVPASVDLNKYRAVTIWCNRFSVNFGTAPLNRAGASS